jgi:hypothetical protein
MLALAFKDWRLVYVDRCKSKLYHRNEGEGFLLFLIVLLYSENLTYTLLLTLVKILTHALNLVLVFKSFIGSY